jgi:peptide/nickel transport system permease protein
MIPVLFMITFLSFLLMHMIPGNPARLMLGERRPTRRSRRWRRSWGSMSR